MVALAPNTSETSTWDVLDTFPKLHSRAREAFTARCTEAPHSKSRNGIEIWQVVYESRIGLESFTRDPIGYAGSEWDLYEFVGSNPPKSIDPMGLATTTTLQGTTCKTILLPGTLDCTCGSKAQMQWGVVTSVTAAIQAEFPGIKVSVGGGLATAHNLSITCNLPSCPSHCGCDEEKKCDRMQKLRGELTICIDKFRVQTDPYVICIPFSQYEETCFTIWPGSDTTFYAYNSHSFGEKVISDFGDCACVATK